MVEDAELLRRYAEKRSEDAFAELVRRHVNFVYTVALRQVGGDAHLAEDVTQVVFSAVARKAESLAQRPVLGGWLYRTTQFAAIDVVRSESRRRIREQEAQAMHELTTDTGTSPDWGKLRPVLDQTMNELKDDDRDALWLRFFAGSSFAEIGGKLQLTENTARMRVERALDKMHALLARRGVTSTTAALGVALANQVSGAAPAGLATAVTSAALNGAAMGTGATLAATFMSMTKLQLGIAGALALAGATSFMMQAETKTALQNEIARLQQQNQGIAALQAENIRLANVALEVEALRRDEAALAPLRDEAAALKQRLQSASVAAPAKREDGAGPGVVGEVYDLSVLDRPPKSTSQATPLPSRELSKAKIPGKVVVEFVVDAKGAVHDVHVLSSTHSGYEASVLEAVSHWQYEPGEKNGRAVNARVKMPFVFTFAKDEDPPGESPPPAAGGKKPARFIPWF